MDPLPYNVTLLSQTASISYLPTRDGKPDAGWSSIYPSGSKDLGYGRPQGVGPDYHKSSFAGASLEFAFTGTAVYLYGTAVASDAYSISVDGTNIGSAGPVGVLGTKTGLKYGEHTVKLAVLGKGEVAFNRAEMTIGVGYPGSDIQNRTIYAADETPTPAPNPYFQYGGSPNPQSWRAEPSVRTVFRGDGSSYQLPLQVVTNTQGDSLTFMVNNATAFFLYGAVNFDHGGGKRATITPASSSQGKSQALDDSSDLLDFDQVLYWQSGLNRDETYTVQIITGQQNPTISFNRLVFIDGGKARAAQHNSSTSGHLGAGVIAGIAVGAAALTGCLVFAFLFWRRRRRISRRERYDIDIEPTSMMDMNHHQITPFSDGSTPAGPVSGQDYFSTDSVYPATNSSTALYPAPVSTASSSGASGNRALDAGTVDGQLPPEYQPDWNRQPGQSSGGNIFTSNRYPSDRKIANQ